MAGVLGRLRCFALAGKSLGLSGSSPSVKLHPVIKFQRNRYVIAAAAADKIKKPPTAFQLFQKDPKTREGLSNIPLAEISKKISGRWKTLSESEKQRYGEQANILKDEFEKLHGQKKKRASSSGSSRPTSGYALYVKENFAGAKSKLPNASAVEVMKELGKQWKGLSAAQKGKYTVS